MYNVSFTSFKLTAKKTTMDNIEGVLNTVQVVLIGMTIANFLLNTGCFLPAIELCEECLILLNSEALDKDGPITDSILVKSILRVEAMVYRNHGKVFQLLGNYNKAQEYYKKAHAITLEIGDREGEATVHGDLGIALQSFGN